MTDIPIFGYIYYCRACSKNMTVIKTVHLMHSNCVIWCVHLVRVSLVLCLMDLSFFVSFSPLGLRYFIDFFSTEESLTFRIRSTFLIPQLCGRLISCTPVVYTYSHSLLVKYRTMFCKSFIRRLNKVFLICFIYIYIYKPMEMISNF